MKDALQSSFTRSNAEDKNIYVKVESRRAVKTNDAAACIVAGKGFGSRTADLVEALRAACPELTGIVLNINKSRGNTVLTEDFYTLWGRAEVRDILCGFEFEIAPQAFFQINPAQAERLYAKAVEYAFPHEEELAFDLYCGAGTISLYLSRHAKKVIGAEIVPERIVYVSCNPATLARDILRFNGLGYTLKEATAVDTFPRTCHVETVVLMSRA